MKTKKPLTKQGAYIARRMEIAKIDTLKELARRADLTTVTINRIMHEDVKIRRETAARLSTVLGVKMRTFCLNVGVETTAKDWENEQTICWTCINAVPDGEGHGCRWSRSLRPVKGWSAVEHYHPNGRTGLKVVKCPEYRKG